MADTGVPADAPVTRPTLSSFAEVAGLLALLMPGIGVGVLVVRYVVARFPGSWRLATVPGLSELALLGFRTSLILVAISPLVYSLRNLPKAVRGGHEISDSLRTVIEKIDEAEALFKDQEGRIDRAIQDASEEDVDIDALRSRVQGIGVELYGEDWTPGDMGVVDSLQSMKAGLSDAQSELEDQAKKADDLTGTFAGSLNVLPKGPSSTAALVIIGLSVIVAVFFGPFPSTQIFVGGAMLLMYLVGRAYRRAVLEVRPLDLSLLWPSVGVLVFTAVVSGGLNTAPSTLPWHVAFVDAEIESGEYLYLGSSANLSNFVPCADSEPTVLVVPTSQVAKIQHTQAGAAKSVKEVLAESTIWGAIAHGSDLFRTDWDACQSG